jgi:hypothetical protein
MLGAKFPEQRVPEARVRQPSSAFADHCPFPDVTASKESAIRLTTNQDAGSVGMSTAVKAVILECAVGSGQQTGDRVQRARPPLNVALICQHHGVPQQMSLLPSDHEKLSLAFVTQFMDRLATVVIADTTRDPTDSFERLGYLAHGRPPDT